MNSAIKESKRLRASIKKWERLHAASCVAVVGACIALAAADIKLLSSVFRLNSSTMMGQTLRKEIVGPNYIIATHVANNTVGLIFNQTVDQTGDNRVTLSNLPSASIIAQTINPASASRPLKGPETPIIRTPAVE